ncbi:hypothetical protein HBA54_25835 [Pelagibius litoralis]|uniref:Sulphotransferase Stf0 domain-containing protein n=1 Tax=Pelagibius litoralis TaxID=374515 RepID=A0A967KD32_9PROT|nr:hypothetical protein [Pelagibius litoralis]
MALHTGAFRQLEAPLPQLLRKGQGDDLCRFLHRVEDEAAIKPLRISYEVLCADPAETVRRTSSFLGLDPSEDRVIDTVPPILRQSDPQKAGWQARYLEEVAKRA